MIAKKPDGYGCANLRSMNDSYSEGSLPDSIPDQSSPIGLCFFYYEPRPSGSGACALNPHSLTVGPRFALFHFSLSIGTL